MKFAKWAILLLSTSALAAPAAAQCATLGTPGFTGCGLASNDAPTIACNGAPTIGNSAFGVTATIPCMTGFPILFVGTCATPPGQITGPFGTNGFCAAASSGCLVYVGPTLFFGLLGTPNPATWDFALPIPNDPSLTGATVCVQEANSCILFVGSCLAVSHGLSITLQ